MTSNLVGARNQIVTDIEALTPPTNTRVSYHHVDSRTLEGHRYFWFPAAEITRSKVRAVASGTSGHRYDIAMLCRLSTAGAGTALSFDDVLNEGNLLANTINARTNWGTGVCLIECDGFTAEPTDSDDVEINFQIVAEIEETDGI